VQREVSDREIQGWYFLHPASEPEHVRLSIDEHSLSLFAPSDRLIARWSLDQLENRGIAILSERWSIGDRRVPDAYLVLESDDDYRAVRKASAKLRPVRARLWRHLGIAIIETGDLGGWPVWLFLIIVAGAALGLWQLS
jgi:hypothetical protein